RVYAALTMLESLRYFAALVGGRERIASVVATVGLGDRTSSLVRDLSGGQRPGTSPAFALLGAPGRVVLDEPTVGVDPRLRRELWETFHRLAADGTTLMVSTHV